MQHALQHLLLDRRDLRIAARARARELDALIQRDAVLVDQQHPIGERDRLGHVVRDEQGGEAVAPP